MKGTRTTKRPQRPDGEHLEDGRPWDVRQAEEAHVRMKRSSDQYPQSPVDGELTEYGYTIAQLHRIEWFQLPQDWRGRGERSASVRCWTSEWDALKEEENFESVPTISFRRKDSPIRNPCLPPMYTSSGSNRHRSRTLHIVLSMSLLIKNDTYATISITTCQYTLPSFRADHPRKRSERGDRTRGMPRGGLAVMER
jgi:hypothetical protein